MGHVLRVEPSYPAGPDPAFVVHEPGDREFLERPLPPKGTSPLRAGVSRCVPSRRGDETSRSYELRVTQWESRAVCRTRWPPGHVTQQAARYRPTCTASTVAVTNMLAKQSGECLAGEHQHFRSLGGFAASAKSQTVETTAPFSRDSRAVSLIDCCPGPWP